MPTDGSSLPAIALLRSVASANAVPGMTSRASAASGSTRGTFVSSVLPPSPPGTAARRSRFQDRIAKVGAGGGEVFSPVSRLRPRALYRRSNTPAPARGPVARPKPPSPHPAVERSAMRDAAARGRDLELPALHAHLDQGRVAAQLRPAAAGGGVEVVEEVVGVQGVVVEEQQPPGADAVGEGQGVARSGSGPSRCARGTPRRCTGSRGSRGRRREPGRSRRSTPAPGRRGSRPGRARGRGCSRPSCRPR